jgi:hypothetical protein
VVRVPRDHGSTPASRTPGWSPEPGPASGASCAWCERQRGRPSILHRYAAAWIP